MKITFVTPYFADIFILDQITGLLQLGHDVRVIACHPHTGSFMDPRAEAFRLLGRTTCLEIPVGKIERVIRAIPVAARQALRSPARTLECLDPREYVRVANLKPLYALSNCPQFQSDIIYCHFGPNGYLGQYLRRHNEAGRLVVCFHASELSINPRTSGRGVYAGLFREADEVHVVSEYGKRLLVGLGCPPGLVRTQRMGIEPGRFEFHERDLRPGEVPRLLTVARLVEKKGVEHAIRAVAKLAGKGVPCVYTIAGDGPLLCSLQGLTASLGIEDRVKFLGATGRDRVADLYRSSHLFLLPSVTAGNGDEEGLPVVLMEASATGMPVISTFHAGIPESVADGVSGCLVPEGDVDGIVEAVSYLLENPDRWGEMGRAGRAIVEARHDREKLNKELEADLLALLVR